VHRRLGGQLFTVLVVILLLLLLGVFLYKLSQRDTLGLSAVRMRTGQGLHQQQQRSKTSFSSALRPLKSEKAQL